MQGHSEVAHTDYHYSQEDGIFKSFAQDRIVKQNREICSKTSQHLTVLLPSCDRSRRRRSSPEKEKTRTLINSDGTTFLWRTNIATDLFSAKKRSLVATK
uniref:Integrase n=1 Tax=Steinernema glaseri TaxID=37863 RepID=A0A1I8AQK6_9BILA